MKTYLIPGLGFDSSIFEKLELKNNNFEFLNWIEPGRNENIKDYALRFSNRIDDDFENTILIGHSFGGIIAQEIAAIRPIKQVILISSIKSRDELPLQFKLIKPFYIYKLFSKQLTQKTIKYWGKTHDYETIEEQNLVRDMVNRQSNHLLQWSLKQLSAWSKPANESPTKIFQIHGDLDKTFPIKLIQNADKVIRNAGHFMVYKHAELITEIIDKELVCKN